MSSLPEGSPEKDRNAVTGPLSDPIDEYDSSLRCLVAGSAGTGGKCAASEREVVD